METFLSLKTGKRKSDSGAGSSKTKVSRKYDEGYLAYGFYFNEVNSEELPVCLICQKSLTNDSMKPSLLKRHLESCHKDQKDNPLSYFQAQLKVYKGSRNKMESVSRVDNSAQFASYKIAHRIARCKKPHTIAETLILPAALDMVDAFGASDLAKKLKTVPLSNDSIKRKISHISDDLLEQLISAMAGKPFSLQLDEATDSNQDCLLIAYARFVQDKSLSEELLFCKYVEGRCTAEELFGIMDQFLTESSLKWNDCHGLCTDGAQAMQGKHTGLRTLIKNKAPKAQWTHCFIHREALMSKELSVDLHEVLKTIVKAVNYIKTRPLKARFFANLCHSLGSEHDALLFHCETRWLSRGKVLARVFELKEEMRQFLQQESQTDLADQFGDESFLLKMAYMADMFAWLNSLNLKMQGGRKFYHDLIDKLDTFQGTMILMKSAAEEGDLSPFENLKHFVQSNELENPDVSFVSTHIDTLLKGMATYFDCPDSSSFDWLRNPFGCNIPEGFTFQEKAQLLSVKNNSALRIQFDCMELDEFWISVKESNQVIGEKALALLLPFPTSYLCETGFSSVAVLKSKYRNRLSIEADLRVAISNISPRFETICAKHRANVSH